MFARRLASAGAVAAFVLMAASGVKANVVETLHFSGSLTSLFGGPPAAFSGTFDLDFSNDFTSYAFNSLYFNVQGRIFNEIFSPPSLDPSLASIYATNGANDRLTLFFTTTKGTWVGFNQGTITTGVLVASNGFYIGASGVVTRDPLDSPILAPPPPLTDPPPVPTGAVPELSTWAMMIIGLAGLGIATKRRHVLNLLSGRA